MSFLAYVLMCASLRKLGIKEADKTDYDKS